MLLLLLQQKEPKVKVKNEVSKKMLNFRLLEQLCVGGTEYNRHFFSVTVTLDLKWRSVLKRNLCFGKKIM